MHTRIAAILMVLACSPGPARGNCDLSTDAAIDAAYKAASGKALPKENRCARRSETFPDLVAIGSFASDLGCEWHAVLAACKLDPPGYAAAAMAKAGWGKADAAHKLALARAWLRELDDVALMDAGDAPGKGKFGGKQFTGPAASARPGGALAVEGWFTMPGGMLPEMRYRKIRVEFANDGTHGAIETIDDVSVPIR